MKIEIGRLHALDQYYAKIWDGPNGIDVEDFVCSSLGECFEEIIRWRTLNALHYKND